MNITPQWVLEVDATYDGAAARVWKFVEPEDDGDPRMECHIPGSNWLIFAPNAHPYWAWHLMMGVQLNDVHGAPPPHRQYPDAQYELLVLAQSPDKAPPDPREWPMGKNRLALMEPPDALVQFHGPSLDEASEMFELIARSVADGILVPDSDHRSTWTTIVRKTAEHYLGHPEHN